MDLPFSLIGFLLGSPIIAIISLLYLKEYKLRQNADQKSTEIARETQLKSVELLNAAQSAETKILSDTDQSIKQVLESSTIAATNAQKELFDFLGELKNLAVKSQAESQKSVEERVNQMFERLETRLSEFLMKTEQSSTSSIELELRSARALIEGYKTQQMALIDENIVAMMEQTLSIVLAKKLSLKDQLDLIYEALEKAKVEKFLV